MQLWQTQNVPDNLVGCKATSNVGGNLSSLDVETVHLIVGYMVPTVNRHTEAGVGSTTVSLYKWIKVPKMKRWSRKSQREKEKNLEIVATKS